jgi:hypothetical protein
MSCNGHKSAALLSNSRRFVTSVGLGCAHCSQEWAKLHRNLRTSGQHPGISFCRGDPVCSIFPHGLHLLCFCQLFLLGAVNASMTCHPSWSQIISNAVSTMEVKGLLWLLGEDMESAARAPGHGCGNIQPCCPPGFCMGLILGSWLCAKETPAKLSCCFKANIHLFRWGVLFIEPEKPICSSHHTSYGMPSSPLRTACDAQQGPLPSRSCTTTPLSASVSLSPSRS